MVFGQLFHIRKIIQSQLISTMSIATSTCKNSTNWDSMLRDIEFYMTSSTKDLKYFREPIELLMERYSADESDFRQYVRFDNKAYTKNLVKQIGDACNIIVMCWAPGQSSAFHSHEGARCLVKVLKGCVTEDRLPLDATSKAQLVQTTRIAENQVGYIDDLLGCHRVSNNSLVERAVTLHVYSPPYRSVRVFDKVNNITDRVVSLGSSQILRVKFDNEISS